MSIKSRRWRNSRNRSARLQSRVARVASRDSRPPTAPSEATKPDFGSDRKQKWLTHFAAVTSADAPVNYGDFLLFTALELAISSFTAAVDESELPDGLGKWWNKMLKTKAVAALKGKGKKLMPGEHNKAW